MENKVITSVVVGIELTEEEVAKILKEREKQANKEEAKMLLGEVRKLLDAIDDLGFKVRAETIGGKYVPRHDPLVASDTISLSCL